MYKFENKSCLTGINVVHFILKIIITRGNNRKLYVYNILSICNSICTNQNMLPD